LQWYPILISNLGVIKEYFVSLKKLLKEYTPEEIADAMILPAKLTLKQKKEADKQLAEHREKRRLELAVNLLPK